MPDKVKLDIAIAEAPHTAALFDGRVAFDGIEANFLRVKPQIAAFRRMVREVAYDVCELAPTTYIIARAHGAPFVGLPIFVMRQFHHGSLLVRPDAGIAEPRDLEGRRVGVRAYSVTTGVWNRQLLIDEYGLDDARVTWVVDDEEHVTALRLPANVEHAAEGRSLAQMMDEGDLVAGMAGAAGIGRSGSPTGGWKELETDYPSLLPDPHALAKAWYGRTGIYPMHGTIVVKDAVLAAHPWVAQSLAEGFEAAKQLWLAEFQAGRGETAEDRKYRKLAAIVGPDPLPYGMAANRATIEALEHTAFRQRLIPRRMAMDELFVDPARG